VIFGAKVNVLVAEGEYWRLLTAIFLHDNSSVLPLHLFFNMYALYILGPQIEAVYGSARFLTIYLLSGLAGSVLSYAFGPLDVPSVGASGAIFGLLGAIIAYSYRYRDNLRFGRQQLMNAVGVALMNFLLGLSLRGIIDNWAHFGGLIGGLVTGMLLIPLYRVETVGPLAQPTVVDRNSLARQAPALLFYVGVLVAAIWYITLRWRT
jgi:rhomboid protease GluP